MNATGGAVGFSSPLEIIIIGGGVPEFSMGWTHLFQALHEPCLTKISRVVGVVEPFFLSDVGKEAGAGAEAFRRFAKAAEEGQPFMTSDGQDLGPLFVKNGSIAFCASCRELPPVQRGKTRIGVVAVRTPDAPRAFRDAVEEAGCRCIYIEKPGATSEFELIELAEFARAHGVRAQLVEFVRGSPEKGGGQQG